MTTERAELDEILDELDMEHYLDIEGVDYKLTHGSSGMQLNLKECPFCGGDKSKVYINQETGLGNCFSGSCPKGSFNKWSFIKEHIGATNNKAVVEHIKLFVMQQGWRPIKKKGKKVSESWGSPDIPESVPIREDDYLPFLKQRHIKPYIAEYFKLRFSKDGIFEYGFGDLFEQDYSNRVIIPIYDMEGTLVSFQGRDVTGESEKKYLFPPGYSSTGVYVFNANNYDGEEDAVLNEGAFDVFATKQAFDEDDDLRDVLILGSFGKNLSHGSEQSQLFEFKKMQDRGLKSVTIMWDGEKSALKSAGKACELFKGIGLKVYIALLPKGKDPNEVDATTVRRAYYARRSYSKMEMTKLLITAYR
jgi:DNA primase